MSPALARLDGGLRVRLDESGWAACATGLDVPGPLRPAQPPADLAIEPALRQAVTVALTGPALVQLTTAVRGRGLVASIGCNGQSAAGAARVVLPAGVAGDEPMAVPGVEVSAFPPDRIVAELLRLIPPDRADSMPQPVNTDPVVLPHTAALMLSRALRDDDQPLVRELVAASGWADVPEVIARLADGVTANATAVFRGQGRVSLSSAVASGVPGVRWQGGGERRGGATSIDDNAASVRAGRRAAGRGIGRHAPASTPRTRQWLQCALGWVELAVAGGEVTHRVVDRAGIAATLVEELTIALERSLAVTSR